ncbi:MAG: hypothetical protein II885_15305 [Oscillospiraceae bacterium]|nr:hypothetical protein [Oscillospiraceae bacterium]
MSKVEEKAKELSTTEMWRRLFRSPAANAFLEDNENAFILPTFSEYITELCRIKGEKPERVLKRANIESSFGHRLFNGNRKPSRDTVLQLSFGLDLDVDKTQQLLKVAREAPLHPKVKRDAVIAWCLKRSKSVDEAQQILLENELPILGGAKHGAD